MVLNLGGFYRWFHKVKLYSTTHENSFSLCWPSQMTVLANEILFYSWVTFGVFCWSGRQRTISHESKFYRWAFMTESLIQGGMSQPTSKVFNIYAYKLSTIPRRLLNVVLLSVCWAIVFACTATSVSYHCCKSWWAWISYWYPTHI